MAKVNLPWLGLVVAVSPVFLMFSNHLFKSFTSLVKTVSNLNTAPKRTSPQNSSRQKSPTPQKEIRFLLEQPIWPKYCTSTRKLALLFQLETSP
jgi:hypothetical protein